MTSKLLSTSTDPTDKDDNVVPAWGDSLNAALTFHQSFDSGPNAVYAKGSREGEFSSDYFPYDYYLQDGVRGKGLVVEGSNQLKYRSEKNIRLDRGGICFWIKTLFDWNQKVGRIPFDMRYEKENVTPHPDPSQRMALTYNVKKGRTWRFFISVDRNCYMPGTTIRRDDATNPRSRFYVGSGPQRFALGQWRHVALTWGRKRAAIYLDGVLEGENVLNDGTLTKLPEYFQIGAQTSWMNANALSHIDEFYIFNRPLTANETRRVYESYGHRVASVLDHSARSPRLLFKENFTQKSFLKVASGSVSSKDIILFKGRTALKLGPGKRLDFPATGKLRIDQGSVRLRVVPDFNATAKGVVTWFQAVNPAPPPEECLFEISYPFTYRNFGVNFSNRGDLPPELDLKRSGQHIFSGSHRFAPGEIFDIVFCWDGEYGHFHVNGELEGKVKLNDGVPTKTPDLFCLGTSRIEKSSLTGFVLDFEIYDGPLSQKHVKNLYQEMTK